MLYSPEYSEIIAIISISTNQLFNESTNQRINDVRIYKRTRPFYLHHYTLLGKDFQVKAEKVTNRDLNFRTGLVLDFRRHPNIENNVLIQNESSSVDIQYPSRSIANPGH